MRCFFTKATARGRTASCTVFGVELKAIVGVGMESPSPADVERAVTRLRELLQDANPVHDCPLPEHYCKNCAVGRVLEDLFDNAEALPQLLDAREQIVMQSKTVTSHTITPLQKRLDAALVRWAEELA